MGLVTCALRLSILDGAVIDRFAGRTSLCDLGRPGRDGLWLVPNTYYSRVIDSPRQRLWRGGGSSPAPTQAKWMPAPSRVGFDPRCERTIPTPFGPFGPSGRQ